MKKIWYWVLGAIGLVLAVVFRSRRKAVVAKPVPLTDWDKKLDEVTADVRSNDLADEAREPTPMPKELSDTSAWRIE